ncbi:MAG: hypothetical protein ACOCT9_01565 [archaeon]
MKRVLLILFCLVGIIFFICNLKVLYFNNVSALTYNEMQKELEEEARIINNKKIKFNQNLSSKRATNEELSERIKWLGHYSKERNSYDEAWYTPGKGYNSKRLWKDVFSMVWVESWFINYKSHDQGAGFGYGGMQWSTAKDMAEVYDWDWEKEKSILKDFDHPQNNKLQAKYIVGYVYWMYEYYNQDRQKAIAGYNTGTGVEDPDYNPYFLAVSGRIHKVDGTLNKAHQEKVDKYSRLIKFAEKRLSQDFEVEGEIFDFYIIAKKHFNKNESLKENPVL